MARHDLGYFFCLRTDLELEVEAAIAQLEAGVRNQFQFFVENLEKSSPNPPKSIPGASKIEPGGLQDAIFKRPLT